MFVGGIVLYLRSTKNKDKTGIFAFWGLIGLLSIMYVVNLFGPPPPNVNVIAVAGNAMWLFVLWAYWINRHRTSVENQSTVHS
jgi:FtsH-binding integral membrane protein